MKIKAKGLKAKLKHKAPVRAPAEKKEEPRRMLETNPIYDAIYSTEFRKAYGATSAIFHELHRLREDVIFKQLGKEFGISLGVLESLLIEESKESWERLRDVFFHDKIAAIPLVAQVAEYNALAIKIGDTANESEAEPRDLRHLQNKIDILMQSPYDIHFLKPYWRARRLMAGDRNKNRDGINEAFKELGDICMGKKSALELNYGIVYEEVKEQTLKNPKSAVETVKEIFKSTSFVQPFVILAQIFEFEALKEKRGSHPRKQQQYQKAIGYLMKEYFNKYDSSGTK
ncbi:hypothetical protein KY336_02750 [Candidatus Woesearchaeota archaeon]|nr:hypothetical protein [Candidatus Woesearchaeota archaeon]